MNQSQASQITPDMIDTGGDHWWDSFGEHYREVSAKLFVKACQKAGGWTVTQEQLDEQDTGKRFIFNGLVHDPRDRVKFTPPWIMTNEDKTYTASDAFILHCFYKFPAKGHGRTKEHSPEKKR